MIPPAHNIMMTHEDGWMVMEQDHATLIGHVSQRPQTHSILANDLYHHDPGRCENLCVTGNDAVIIALPIIPRVCHHHVSMTCHWHVMTHTNTLCVPLDSSTAKGNQLPMDESEVSQPSPQWSHNLPLTWLHHSSSFTHTRTHNNMFLLLRLHHHHHIIMIVCECEKISKFQRGIQPFQWRGETEWVREKKKEAYYNTQWHTQPAKRPAFFLAKAS